MARNGNAKGGLDGGFLDTFGVEYNTRALLIDARWTTTPNGQTTPTVMTYAFTKDVSDYTAAPNYSAQNLLVGFAEVTSEQKIAVRTALDLVSSFTKLTFTESSSGLADDAALRFSHNRRRRPRSEAYPWPGSGVSGDVFLGSGGNVPAQYFGTDGFLTITHEIGHALGLKHGHETDTHGALTPDRNSNEFSIMTYASYIGSHPPPITTAVDGSSAQNYMMYDIAALQVLYGANWNKLGSGETYTWSGSTGQQSIDGKAAPFTGNSSYATRSSRPCGLRARPPPTTSATSPRTRSTISGRASGSPSPTASSPTSTTSCLTTRRTRPRAMSTTRCSIRTTSARRSPTSPPASATTR